MSRRYDITFNSEHYGIASGLYTILQFDPSVDFGGGGPLGDSTFWIETTGTFYSASSARGAVRRVGTYRMASSLIGSISSGTQENWVYPSSIISSVSFMQNGPAVIWVTFTAAYNPGYTSDYFWRTRVVAYEP